MSAPLVSVIVPTWNEEATIGASLDALLVLARAEPPVEILVVDGGSEDRTREIAASKVRCLVSSKGRGPQMNAGAQASQGEILLFLHADCHLDPGAIAAARQVLASGKNKAGCYRQKVQARALVYRFVEWASAIRARCFGIVYGDCGLFLRRATFEKIGGFPGIPLFEDFGISQRLRAIPGRVALASASIHVSARRWKKLGFWRTTWLNWSLAFSYLRGTDPETLCRRYEKR